MGFSLPLKIERKLLPSSPFDLPPAISIIVGSMSITETI
jgi:hypothetical protein